MSIVEFYKAVNERLGYGKLWMSIEDEILTLRWYPGPNLYRDWRIDLLQVERAVSLTAMAKVVAEEICAGLAEAKAVKP